ncbi:Csu type fimbrial protein [Ancylobacter oerskovii]|uniref:Csu type fimbrial protein n=1 Tax=Ancylobacter oerskovii TaxID=459519 RepID=UPI001BD198DD|nr:spore coat U domain-containing protein [Ancylobacter oerskovii]MBS7544862.1 spore coat U domain-containing protein [Ancylobacter oerskovii]
MGCVALASGLALSAGGTANAVTTTSNLGVSITINATCAISAVSNVNFGSVGLLNTALTAEGSFEVQCTNGTPYVISLGTGTGTGATTTNRLMTSGAETVAYSLYRDSGHTQVWGVDSGTDTVSASGNGSAQPYTVYGRVPSQTTPTANTYSDTVIISVDY